MTPVLAQIVQRYLPRHKIEELAKDEAVKAREFSYSAQVYLLMLGQLAYVFSLNVCCTGRPCAASSCR